MKNLFFYYFVILAPIPVLGWLALKSTSYNFLIGLIIYYFYRCITDGLRLVAINCIKKDEFWKTFIPFWNSTFFVQQYFKK